MRWIVLLLIFVLVMGCEQAEQQTPPPSLPTLDLACSADSDCVVRQNDYRWTRACHKDDPDCAIWETTPATGSPGHTEYPDKELLKGICTDGICEYEFDTEKCTALRQEYSFCAEYEEGTYNGICIMYRESGCHDDLICTYGWDTAPNQDCTRESVIPFFEDRTDLTYTEDYTLKYYHFHNPHRENGKALVYIDPEGNEHCVCTYSRFGGYESPAVVSVSCDFIEPKDDQRFASCTD